MAFLNPIWLWGLSALTIPIAIHLLSRKEGKVIAIGSLRHLSDTTTQQFKSLRLNELLLLFLRCLLITLIVLLISGLQISKGTTQKWVLLEYRLKENLKVLSLVDSLITKGYELHYISNERSSAKDILTFPSYWSLTEDLKTKNVSEAIIISMGRVESFKGARIERPAAVTMITIPMEGSEYLVQSMQKEKDSVIAKWGSLKNLNTVYREEVFSNFPEQRFFKSGNDSVSTTPPATINILIANEEDFMFDQQILLASLQAIQSAIPEKLIIKTSDTQLQQDSTDVLIWLSEKELPSVKTKKILYYRKNLFASLFQHVSDSSWQLTQHLDEDIALHENMTIDLAEIIIPNTALWEIAIEKDQRIMPEKMMWSKPMTDNSKSLSQASLVPLDDYLILLILFVLLTERFIAYRRNQ